MTKLYGNVRVDVLGDVRGNINGKNWKNEYFLGGMAGYDAGLKAGIELALAYLQSGLADTKSYEDSLNSLLAYLYELSATER